MDSLIRIGGRLFNLLHVTSIEPEVEAGELVVDVHIVAGRSVRLREDDARAASTFISAIDPLPVDQAAQDQAVREERAAQDQYIRQFPTKAENGTDPVA